MLRVGALSALSYNHGAEAEQQGTAFHPLQGVFLVFVLLPVRGERREGFKWFKWFKEFKWFKGSAPFYPSKITTNSLGLGWLVACLIFSLMMVGLYKLLWSTVLTCCGRSTRGVMVDRPSTLWSTDQRPLERRRTELNEN